MDDPQVDNAIQELVKAVREILQKCDDIGCTKCSVTSKTAMGVLHALPHPEKWECRAEFEKFQSVGSFLQSVKTENQLRFIDTPQASLGEDDDDGHCFLFLRYRDKTFLLQSWENQRQFGCYEADCFLGLAEETCEFSMKAFGFEGGQESVEWDSQIRSLWVSENYWDTFEVFIKNLK
mmetsp:Transcript_29021/g.44884  ORF Transcript_29021/g.44884 Transcript_29021/m.44884 type:complete len:178 (-) Transcript_29021:62-595(-)